MKAIQDWLQAVNDNNLPIRERMFRLLAIVGLFALGGMLLVSVALHEHTYILVSMGIGIVVFVGLIFFVTITGKTGIGIYFIGTILVFVLMPVVYFTGGGIYGGSTNWFVFCYIYIGLMMSGRGRKAFLLAHTIVVGCCYIVSYFHPGLVVRHTDSAAYIDSFASVLLLSTAICVMILFQVGAFKKESQLAEQQKKEIIDLNQSQNRFFSSMSHEIRTPINTIIGLNEMTLREDISEEVAENSIHIQAASKILLSLINDILDMSKIESGKMNIVEMPYDVGDMLSEIVNMIWVRAQEKGLEFHIDLDPAMPTQLMGDDVRIKQILVNILNNAVKYTSEGSVTLNVQCTKRIGNSALISYIISDTGSGIKKENIPYLFTAFRRVEEGKNKYIEGTGLGLSIVKQLVDLMHGEISVNSIYTKGSTFTVVLRQEIVDGQEIGNLNLEERHGASERKHYKQRLEAPNARVLIVDDNELNLLVAEKLLKFTKVQVETVTSAAECLQKSLSTRYDLIFMDHLMPNMDGVECYHALREQNGGMNNDTPIIVLTANAGSDLLAMYKREGFDDCLLKPVTGELLENALIKFLPREKVSLIEEEAEFLEESGAVHHHLRKRPFAVTTESVCDLPEWVLENHQITVIPYDIHAEQGYFLDGIEVKTDELLSYITDGNKFAIAKEPSVEDFEKFFASMLEKAQYIIHVSASKKMSGAYANAMEASQTFDNVTVIDSGHMSSGIGLVAMKAAELAESDMHGSEIVRILDEYSRRIRTSFVLDSMRFLARTGRVPKRALALCEAFMMHPIVEIMNGVMRPRKLSVGSRRMAWKRYITSEFSTVPLIDKSILFVTYSGVSDEDLSRVAERVQKEMKFEKVVFQKVSCASSALFGANTFGLIYATMETKGVMI